MPLPLILIGIAVGSGLIGLGSGAKAASDTSKARRIREDSEEEFKEAETKLIEGKSATQKQLEQLGETKLRAWDTQLGRFVKLFEQIRNVEITGSIADDMNLIRISDAELGEIKQISLHASEVIGGGVAAAGAGALAGFGAYGGATMLASASTGTAISSLSGVAATNATLAWFGGGSLASGGLGMAGGTMVLGGLVAGPALLVGGIALSAVAKKKLAEARADAAKASVAIAEMNKVAITLQSIKKIAKQFDDFICKLLPHVDESLIALAEVIDRSNARLKDQSWHVRVMNLLREIIGRPRIDYVNFSDYEKRVVCMAVSHIDLLKQALETPLLCENGAIHPEVPKKIKSFVQIASNLGTTRTELRSLEYD